MASERSYRSVTQPFTVDGTVNGIVQVTSAKHFKVKATVVIKSSTSGPLTLEIKSVPSKTVIEVGPCGSNMELRTDLSSFLVSDGATIKLPRQKRPSIGPGEIDRYTYAEEPTVARRVTLVDEYGDEIDDLNPLPVNDVGSVATINPHVMNFSIPLANTEYQIVLPVKTKWFFLRMRNTSKCFLAYAAGETLTNFFTLNCGGVYHESELSLAAPLTLFLSCVKPAEIVEIVYWT